MDGNFFWEMVALEVGKQKTSFEWLYRKTKVAKGTFSSWKARNLFPRADVAYRIAEALGVTVEYLLTGREQYKQVSNLLVHTAMEEITRELVFFDRFDLETLRVIVSSMAQRYQM
jgi:transcriptional regulator with XRE-family HTH domain